MKTQSMGLMMYAAAVGLAIAMVWVASVSPALPHSWYSSTKDPETNLGCCGGQDCKPIPSDSVKLDKENGGWRYLPTGELIPWSRVQQSYDFDFHRCIYLRDFVGDKGQTFKQGDTRCFFVPGGTM